jgi:hypothetical protein
MNNEPVAWMNKDDSSLSFKKHGGGWQPLYTHPAKILTDKEIEQIADDHIDWIYETGFIEFARAILKKAREHE